MNVQFLQRSNTHIVSLHVLSSPCFVVILRFHKAVDRSEDMIPVGKACQV